jgi:hypothetical protein
MGTTIPNPIYLRSEFLPNRLIVTLDLTNIALSGAYPALYPSFKYKTLDAGPIILRLYEIREPTTSPCATTA